MKIISTFLFLILLIGCNHSKKTIESYQETYTPIIKNNQVEALTKGQEKIIEITIIQNIQLYTESCKKRQKIKSKLNEHVFVEVSDKNPSQSLLNKLNKVFNSDNTFFAAKNGVKVFNQWLLIGYKDLKKHEKGYLVYVSIIDYNQFSASVALSESRTALGGVSKTYQLKKENAQWKVTGCQVDAYN